MIFRLYILTILLLFFSCDFFNTEFDDLEDAVLYESKSKTTATSPPAVLKIMNWNIKFGGGRIDFFFDCYDKRVLMTENEVTKNLDNLIKKINEYNPDILIVQEIDINSKRAAYIDQVQYILDRTQLNYAAYASQWKADYVPSDGIGRVDSGNAIFSRWKFISAERIALPLRSDQPDLDKYFYLKRNILKTNINLSGGKNIYVAGIHAAAYSTDGTKKKQIDIFKKELDKLKVEGENLIGAGDLNTVPPNSAKTSNFPDSICEETYIADDYSEEKTWLDELYALYNPAISLAEYGNTEEQNAPYYTHTTNKNGFWNRKLDYIFTNLTIVSGTGFVHQNDTMPLSDHAPLTVEVNIP
ncbi:MAG: endonuclease/exonuclease/phosphatase family protein [Spirochaetia bacterium]|nr:endonuclease/exonuclease/phosphatase family protein [Spirochaetia bacterium]